MQVTVGCTYSNYRVLKGYRLVERNNGLTTECDIWLRKCGSTTWRSMYISATNLQALPC